MVPDGTSDEAAASGSNAPEPFRLKALALGHKRMCALVVGLLLVVIALSVVPALVGSGGGALADSTTCSGWSAASSAQQTAYAHLYLNEYGGLSNTAGSAGAVQRAISSACVRAAYLGEADDVSVLAAIRHDF